MKLRINVRCAKANAFRGECERVIIAELRLAAKRQWRNDRERGNKQKGEHNRKDYKSKAKPMQLR